MDNLRLLLYVAFGFVLLLLWQSWVTMHAPPPSPSPPTSPSEEPAVQQPQDLPGAGVTEAKPRPAEVTQDHARQKESRYVVVETDLIRARIDTRGGDIHAIELLTMPVDLGKPEEPQQLFYADGNGRYIMQSGLLHDRLPGAADDLSDRAPSHHAEYGSERFDYRLSDDEDQLQVALLWRGEGVDVEKLYVFERGSYLIEIRHLVRNRNDDNWTGRQYAQLRRDDNQPEQSYFIYTFTGAAYYDGTYNKQSFEDIADEPLRKTVRGGWVAMSEHYFLGALLPAEDDESDFYSKAVSGELRTEFIIGLRSQPLTVAPSTEAEFTMHLYAGPKLQKSLEVIAEGLELTTDYGIFTFISKPLFWGLEKIHSVLGNWGWSIIVLTFLIKLVFYKLSEAGYRSMARMRKFQPRLMALRERYKDDRERLNREMMDLYRKEKINPLGGCFPILVQIPVFIALYWVLLESVELRQAPFILWVRDLSEQDPYFVLPLLMGVTMLIQNRLNPTPPDPLQAKIMTFLPFIFTFFFIFFPSGLVLYWLANNVLSIAQQWFILRRIEQAR